MSFIDDVDQGNSFAPSTLKPSSNSAVEVDRWLPSGVRMYLRDLVPGEDVRHLPQSIVWYLEDYELVHFPKRGPNMDKLILSPLGVQIRNTNIKRLEGKG